MYVWQNCKQYGYVVILKWNVYDFCLIFLKLFKKLILMWKCGEPNLTLDKEENVSVLQIGSERVKYVAAISELTQYFLFGPQKWERFMSQTFLKNTMHLSKIPSKSESQEI